MNAKVLEGMAIILRATEEAGNRTNETPEIDAEVAELLDKQSHKVKAVLCYCATQLGRSI